MICSGRKLTLFTIDWLFKRAYLIQLISIVYLLVVSRELEAISFMRNCISSCVTSHRTSNSSSNDSDEKWVGLEKSEQAS